MTSWHIDIERVSNGFILRSPGETDDEAEYVRVVHESDQTDAKVDAAVEMLYEVADYFGLLGSKYDRKRLSIGTQPGYAYEDLDETRAESEERTSDMGADGSSMGDDEYVLEDGA